MKIRKHQMGGQVAPEAAPEEQMPQEGGMPVEQGNGQEEVVQQLAQVAQELIQQLGPDAAAMLAQIIMEMLQGGQQGQPVFRRGGKLVGRSF